MSITVRYWTNDELKQIVNYNPKNYDNETEKLITCFVNKSTYDERQIKAYKDMSVMFKLDYVTTIDHELIEFKAPNDDMAKWFISQEYNGVWPIHEVTTHYRKIN